MNKYETYQSGPNKGTPKTLQDRVVRYLIHGLGAEERETKPGSRYRKFAVPYTKSYYFVGKNGAVRVGDTVAGSVSLTQAFHAKMELWELKNRMKK